MKKVSVIVPVYNAENYLEQCLDSLVKQTLNDMEIIVLDDGSRDQSWRIIQHFQKEYPHMIKAYQKENEGLYKTRQFGLEHATGVYVGWVDADDFVALDMFEKLYEAACAHTSDLAYCDYAFYPRKIKTKEKWYRPYTGEKSVSFVERNSQPWNKIAKKELLDRLEIGRMFPTCFDEAYIKVLLMAERPVSIDENLYFYRVGNATMSSSYKNPEHYMNFVKASQALRSELSALCAESQYWKSYFEYREIYYLLQTMVVSANASNKSMFYRTKKMLMTNFPDYGKNQHLMPILKENFGLLKAFVIAKVIPCNYYISYLGCKIAFK